MKKDCTKTFKKMNDCSNHKREVAGISDMKVLAEMIGDLHYDSMRYFLFELHQKIWRDADRDREAGKEQLADKLDEAYAAIGTAYMRINEAWQISKSFMEDKTTEK